MIDTQDSTFASLRIRTKPRRTAWKRAVRNAAAIRPLYVSMVVLAASLVGTICVLASDQVDSGWSVARPGMPAVSEQPTDPKLRIAINHILEQGQTPLLVAPAQTAPLAEMAPVANEPSITREVEFDGWRPANLPHGRTHHAAKPSSGASTSSEPAPSTTEANDAPQLPITAADTTPIAEDESNAVESAPADEAPLTKSPATETAPAETPHSRTLSIEAATPLPKGDPSKVFEISDADDSDSAAETEAEETVEEAPHEPPSRASAIGPAKKNLNELTPLTKQMQSLRTRVRRVLKSYYNRPLNSRDNDPWEMMHGMLAYGIHSHVRQNGPQGRLITSVGWLCYNKPCKGMTLLYATKQGDLRAKYGVGLQGHMGQFLAMLAQCHVAPEYPIRVGKREYHVNDLIEAEKITCYSKSELTFKLISLMHYCPSDTQWVNDQGVHWDIPKLIREELAQPIRGAACGGTHRLSGLSLAARTRVRRGEPLDGEYLRAAQFVEQYHKYAFQMQNRDGSLSTQWFRGRGSESDIDRRVKTTGHILEWLCYSLDDQELVDPRTVRAVSYLTNLLGSNYDHEWEVGPMCHALHALKLYNERVFQPYDTEQEIVSGPGKRNTAKRSMNSSRTRR